MLEIAVRINQLVSSNLNSVVEAASNPAKILKLMVTEIEEAIINLSRDASHCDRRARDLAGLAKRHEKAAADWQDKAKLAMAKDREDLARGALVERDLAKTAAAQARAEGETATADSAALGQTVRQLEAKLAETRQRLATMAAAQQTPPAPPASASSAHASRTDRVMDRIATLEKRADFASDGVPSAKAASLDQELEELARDARLDAELAAMRKTAARKK